MARLTSERDPDSFSVLYPASISGVDYLQDA